MRYKTFISTIIASYVLMTGTAIAGVHAGPVPVPEPGVLPLLVMAAAATAIAYRFRKKK